jgi:hypothetical protein
MPSNPIVSIHSKSGPKSKVQLNGKRSQLSINLYFSLKYKLIRIYLTRNVKKNLMKSGRSRRKI